MENNQPPIPLKSNSFSSSSAASREDKLRQHNLSLNSIQFTEKSQDNSENPEPIDEGDESQEKEDNSEDIQEAPAPSAEEILRSLIEDIDQFLAILLSLKDNAGHIPESTPDNNGEDSQISATQLPDVPESTIGNYIALVDKEVAKYETGESKLSEPILEAIDRIYKLTEALMPYTSTSKCFNTMNLTSTVLHHAMSFLEDEFFTLLDESSKSNKDQNEAKKSKKSSHEPELECELNPNEYYPSPETIQSLRVISNVMIPSGYDTECRQLFAVSRRNAFRSVLSNAGFEKMAIDDVYRMGWDALEGEIGKWTVSVRQVVTESLPQERGLFFSVFEDHKKIAEVLFFHLARNTIHNLLNFPEAVAMTKRSTEKLFKVLDMYEALRDMIPKIDLLFPSENANSEAENKTTEETESSLYASELKGEMSAVKSRLGEAAMAIFCELENSIKSDTGKNVVPGGAVHPLTRYVMNYLKYACEYINTLEQIFKNHRKSDDTSSSTSNDTNNTNDSEHSQFESQLIQVMELLQSNLDSKAKLYKDLALSNIFLMNNGRYIVQKIKGAPEIKQLIGNTWCRKRSSDLRQYHKNYQRETWSKVLACLKDEGLTVKGSVSKPVLKERFKSFNAMFDEIHKVQSAWIVSDEQLQSELRVSISAVIIPAYRSFLGRFAQVLDAGRQTEKYIKYAPEDLEAAVDEFFDGNPASMVRKRT